MVQYTWSPQASLLTRHALPPPPNLPCPSLPKTTGAAARGDDADRGCLFAAHRGAGAYAAPLWDAGGALERVRVADAAEGPGGMAGARFMESYESRHSDHSFTARVVRQSPTPLLY